MRNTNIIDPVTIPVVMTGDFIFGIIVGISLTEILDESIWMPAGFITVFVTVTMIQLSFLASKYTITIRNITENGE